MLNIIYTEFLKLKRSKILLLIPVGGLVPPLLNFLVMLSNNGERTYTWIQNFDLAIMLANFAMATALFALLAGYLYSREYSENTINTIYSYPIPRIKFIIAKLFVMYALIVAVFIMCFAFIVLFGMLLPHKALDSATLLTYVRVFFLMSIMHLALAPISVLLALIGKNVIAPVTLGITAVFVNVVIASSDYSQYFPWCVPGLLSFIHQKFEPQVYTMSITMLTVTFLIGMAATIIYTLKSDVLSRN